MTNKLFSPIILLLVLAFLIGPFLIIIAASLSAGETLAFPPQGLSLRWVLKVFEVESFRASFGISMFLAIGGTLAALILGIPVVMRCRATRSPVRKPSGPSYRRRSLSRVSSSVWHCCVISLYLSISAFCLRCFWPIPH